MVSIKLVRRDIVSDETTVRFLKEAREVILAFHNIYKFLSTDMKSVDTEENREMGIGWEYSILFHLDELVTNVRFDTLNQAVLNMWFAENAATSKLNRGVIVMGDFYQNIAKHLATNTPFSVEELIAKRPHLAYALGDFIYALNQVCCVDEYCEAYINDSPIMLESAYQVFLSDIGMQPFDFVQWLLTMRKNYISVVPIFVNDPLGWADLTAGLPANVVETMVDYGDWIYQMDILAFKRGELVINDDYLDLLQARANSTTSTASQFPDEWLAFQNKIPEELASRALELEPLLTIGAIDEYVNSDLIPDKQFFDAVERFGAQKPGDQTTHRFG